MRRFWRWRPGDTVTYFTGIFLALVFGICASGCASANAVTDDDRVIVEYERQVFSMAGEIVAGLAAVAADPNAVAALAQLMAQGAKMNAHLQKTWGPPKEAPPPLTDASIDKAIQASAKSHVPWYYKVGALLGGLLSLLGVAVKLSPTVARFVPGVSQYVNLAYAVVKGAESYMNKAKASGAAGAAVELVSHLVTAQNDLSVQGIADTLLAKAKEELKVDPNAGGV